VTPVRCRAATCGEMAGRHGVLLISEYLSIINVLELRGACQKIEHLCGTWITQGMKRRQAKALPEADGGMVRGLTACHRLRLSVRRVSVNRAATARVPGAGRWPG
jgi:hypothetical protein